VSAFDLIDEAKRFLAIVPRAAKDTILDAAVYENLLEFTGTFFNHHLAAAVRGEMTGRSGLETRTTTHGVGETQSVGEVYSKLHNY
jgi:hypothetical protein